MNIVWLFLVNGGYSDWASWSPCIGYCGSGLQSRTRTCSNPEPAFNGAGCSGGRGETDDCQHANICPGEDGYDEWSPWTLCIQTCGNSTQIRTRKCRDDAAAEECSEASTQAKPCDNGQCPSMYLSMSSGLLNAMSYALESS